MTTTLTREEWQHAKQPAGPTYKPLWPTSELPKGIFYPPWARNTTAKTVQLIKCGVTPKTETTPDKRLKRKPEFEPYPMKRISFPIAHALDLSPYELGRTYAEEPRPLILIDSVSDQTSALDCQLFRRGNPIGNPCDPTRPDNTIIVSWTGPKDGVYPERDASGVAQEITMDSCWDCLVDGRKCQKVGLILDGPRMGEYLPVEQRRYRSINEIFGLPPQYSPFIKGSRQHVPVKRKGRPTELTEFNPEKKSKPNPLPTSQSPLPAGPTPSASTSAGPPQRSIKSVVNSSPPPAATEERVVSRRGLIATMASRRSQSGDEVDEEDQVNGSIQEETASAAKSPAEMLSSLVDHLPASAVTSTATPSENPTAVLIATYPVRPVTINRPADTPTMSRTPPSTATDKARTVTSINKIISVPTEAVMRAFVASNAAPGAAGRGKSPGLPSHTSRSAMESSQSSSITAVESPADAPVNTDTPAKCPTLVHAAAAAGNSAETKTPPSGPPTNLVPSTSEQIELAIRHFVQLNAERDAEITAASLRAQTLDAENADLATELARIKRQSEAQATASTGREQAAMKAIEAQTAARLEAEAEIEAVKKQVVKANEEKDAVVLSAGQAVKEAMAKTDEAVRLRAAAETLAKTRLMETLEVKELLREESEKNEQLEKAAGMRRTEMIVLKAEVEELRSKKP